MPVFANFCHFGRFTEQCRTLSGCHLLSTDNSPRDSDDGRHAEDVKEKNNRVGNVHNHRRLSKETDKDDETKEEDVDEEEETEVAAPETVVIADFSSEVAASSCTCLNCPLWNFVVLAEKVTGKQLKAAF